MVLDSNTVMGKMHKEVRLDVRACTALTWVGGTLSGSAGCTVGSGQWYEVPICPRWAQGLALSPSAFWPPPLQDCNQ